MERLGDAQPTQRHALPTTNPATLNQKVKSCILCQQRKVRCDRKSPCSVCTKARVECVFRAPVRQRRRIKKIPEIDLLLRVRNYEKLLKDHGISFEAYEDEGRGDSDVGGSENAMSIDSQKPKALPLDATKKEHRLPEMKKGSLIIQNGVSRYLDNDLWATLSEELQQQGTGRQDEANGDSAYASPSVPDTDVLYPDTDILRFGMPRSNKSLAGFHPEPVTVFRLWQTYLNNVNPLTKITHAPTTQQQILEASGHLDRLSKGMESLMFAIYASAVNSMTDQECEAMLGEERLPLLNKYRFATWQSLLGAAFIKSSEMVILQAYTLYLLSVQGDYDPRSIWILTGVAVRIGQRMGIHRDGASLGLSIFDVEMRRRLWWQIMILDGRAAQLAGTGLSVLHRLTDTQAPLNVNDSDLYPNMREPPMEHAGATDMIFIMVRCEIGKYMQRSAISGDYGGWQNGQNLGDAGMTLAKKDKAIDELEDIIERKFVKYCDPIIPLHLFSTILGKFAVAKMRLIAHHPRQYKDNGASLPEDEKDMLFNLSLNMLDWDNMQSNRLLQPFLWHIKNYTQFHPLLYILIELRSRITGDLPDRAWLAINKVFENHPSMLNSPNNALYVAIRSLTIKAWEAREAAMPPQFQGTHVFPLISALRAAPGTKSKKLPSDPQAARDGSRPHNDTAQEQYMPGPEFERLESDLDLNLGAEGDQSFDLSQFDWVDWDNLLEDCDLLMTSVAQR